ncbi:hypothetical protein ACFFRR_007823 [Megaselia abdita]
MGLLLLFCYFFLALLGFLVVIAGINKSVGVRRAYVLLLLRIFEYGRQAAADVNEKRRGSIDDTDSECNPKIEVSQVQNEDSIDGDVEHLEDAKTNGNVLISRDEILLPDGDRKRNSKSESLSDAIEGEDINFNLAKCLDYIKAGIEAIIEDEVTSRFEAEELKSWNLLTRTNRQYEFITWKLTFMWMAGFIIRYLVLMPLRVLICFIGVTITIVLTGLVGFIPYQVIRQPCANFAYKLLFRLFCGSLSTVLNIHDAHNKPKSGICIANHTSPIDIAMLSTDNTYSLIGQRHGGFLGILQRALARASPHIWFERAEAKDRHAVSERLRQHISDPKNPPILIFPEGTCINNTSVMQFKKGSFEVGSVIYPVAIKYDPRFGDAFWNSSKYSMLQYLYCMMTSWAIVCDVWYLPPMYREEGESAIDFANRVKAVIAKKGGLVDLVWDGQLKRMKAKKEWKEKQQEEFTKRLKGE